MKKLMLGLAIAAVGSAFAVESANIVGYNTITIDKEYTLLTVAFESPDGSALSIQNAFPYADGMTKGLAISDSDNIQVMNSAGGYDIYFLSNGKYGKGGASYSEALDGKWSVQGSGAATDATLPVGTTFWYLSRTGKTGSHTLTVAGAVSNAEKETYVINKEYTLIGNPYPAEVALNGGLELTGETKGLAISDSDNIQIMTDAGGYDIYFLSNGKYGKGGASYSEALDGKWSVQGSGTATDATFPVGKGAWYLSRTGSGSISFKTPVK